MRAAVVVAEDAAHRARPAAVGDHVHLGAQHDGVGRGLEHRPAAVEQRVQRARSAGRDDLGAGHEAVAAVVVAAEHAERERARAGEGVEERLLLHGVHLQRAHVADAARMQRAAVVEADAADAVLAGRDQAAMAAGEAPHALVRQLLVQLPLARVGGEEVGQRRRPRRHKPLFNIRR